MGYPIEIFTSPPSDSCICPICHDVLKDAVSFKNCGHTFCDDCVRRLGHNAHIMCMTEICPTCRIEIGPIDYVPNYIVRDMIESLKVGCLRENNRTNKCVKTNDGEFLPNTRNRCTWTGRCADLHTHDDVCPFQIVSCVFQGCYHQCQRKDMNDHLLNELFSHMNMMKNTHELVVEDLRNGMEKMNKVIKCQNEKIHIMQQKIQASRKKIKSLQIKISNMKSNAERGDAVTVKYCGIKEINGVYSHIPDDGNGTTYVKCGFYNNEKVEFKIFRLGIWYITIDYVFTPKDGLKNQSRDLYYNLSEHDELPSSGWECHGTGVQPSPRFFLNHYHH